MKKLMGGILILFISSILIVGCGETGGKSGPGTTKPGPFPEPPVPPPAPLEWGDLKCQKDGNCQNEILNLSLAELGDFFAQEYGWNEDFHSLSEEERTFRCSVHLSKLWQANFGDTIKVSPTEWTHFLLAVFEPTQCKLKNEFKEQLTNYFKNTKEYLNEIN